MQGGFSRKQIILDLMIPGVGGMGGGGGGNGGMGERRDYVCDQSYSSQNM